MNTLEAQIAKNNAHKIFWEKVQHNLFLGFFSIIAIVLSIRFMAQIIWKI